MDINLILKEKLTLKEISRIELTLEETSQKDDSQRRQPLGRPPDVKDSPTSNRTVNSVPTKSSVSFNTENESKSNYFRILKKPTNKF